LEIHGFGRLLITLGLALLAVGVVLVLAPKIPLLGRLPGDLLFRKGGVTIFVPLVTMLLLSLALTVLVNLFARLFR
jgi:hypothetical protein